MYNGLKFLNNGGHMTMTDAQIKMLISMVLYMAVVIAIGVYFPNVQTRTATNIFSADAVLAHG